MMNLLDGFLSGELRSLMTFIYISSFKRSFERQKIGFFIFDTTGMYYIRRKPICLLRVCSLVQILTLITFHLNSFNLYIPIYYLITI